MCSEVDKDIERAKTVTKLVQSHADFAELTILNLQDRVNTLETQVTTLIAEKAGERRTWVTIKNILSMLVGAASAIIAIVSLEPLRNFLFGG